MKVYAVCWQDDAEPWGWEPIEPIYTRRAAAVSRFNKLVEKATADYMRPRAGAGSVPPEDAHQMALRTYSLREYEIE